MVNIISYNINGIRAAIRKDLFSWLKNYNPDIVCFQEIKANEEQFDSSIFPQGCRGACLRRSAEEVLRDGAQDQGRRRGHRTQDRCG